MPNTSVTTSVGRVPVLARFLLFPLVLVALASVDSLRVRAAEGVGTSPAPVVAAPAVVAPPLVSAAMAAALRVGPTDLVYQGAFRVPQGAIGGSSFDYGGGPLVFNPARGSLFIVGHAQQQQVAEIAVPEIRRSTQLSALAVASVLQPFADPTEGRLRTVETDQSQPVSVSGLLPYRGQLYLAGSVFYDGNGSQRLSHFVSGLDLSVSGDVRGPYEVGTLGAGFVSGYFGLVPDAWQAAFGGPVLNGNCCLSIISRTSYGPSAFAIDPTQLGTVTPLPTSPLVYYSSTHPLGPYSADSALFNGSTIVTGVVFPENSRSVLFFGRQGLGTWCYGTGTSNPALIGTLAEPGDYYCYDPTSAAKGGHGYPYAYYVWAYDALDLAAVKSGAMQPWDAKPYAVWPLDLPTAGGAYLLGATYDAQSGRIFVSQGKADGDNPLVHVFTVGPGSPTGPPPVVTMDSPANGATFAPLAAIRMAAAGRNADGQPSTLKVYANNQLLWTGPSPYSVDVTTLAAGTYALTTMATDSLGASTTSSAVRITVAAPSTGVNVALASNGATATASSTHSGSFGAGGVINGERKGLPWGGDAGWNDDTPNAFPDWLEVDFSGSKTIDEIDVFSLQDNFAAPVDPTATLTFSLYGLTEFQVQYWDGAVWQVVPGGTVTGNTLVWRRLNFSPITTARIRVSITGAVDTWSRLVELEAYQTAPTAPPPNVPPTVLLTAPVSSTAFTAPATITLTATAADSDGTVASVSFYANGTLIGSDASSPYSLAWTSVAAGTYPITAVATDNMGLTATSSATTVTVRPPSAPSVSLVSPVDGATVAPLAPLTVTATASDTDGTIAAVAFYADGALLGTRPASPYTLDWTGAAVGTHHLTAIATDDTGLTTTSSTVTVIVGLPSQTLLTTQVPVVPAASNRTAWELGTRLISDVSGQVTAIRFWKSATEQGPHTGHIWSATGTLLASVTFVDETAAGWQQQALATPLSVLANRAYVVSASTGPDGVFASTENGFVTAMVNLHLRAPAGAGSHAVAGVFPSVGTADNYFRDVVFVADADGGDTIAPTVTLTQPVAGATLVGRVTLGATASDNVGVLGVQFQLDGVNSGAEVMTPPFRLPWDSASVPNGPHTVTAIARDAAGHATLASALVTVANVAPAQTLLTTQVPEATDLSFGKGSWEAGMRVVSDVSGQITAIRFWKSAQDTGAHTGHLWSATGQLLASVEFANETASGWQQQAVPTPVAVVAQAVYVVSVTVAPTMLSPFSYNVFATGLKHGHLRAPAGNSGVYGRAGTRPASGSPHNFFRDVVFVADSGNVAP